jgi:4-amino-4-deoxy-L-arabinose transferase-like glycosyltransferase
VKSDNGEDGHWTNSRTFWVIAAVVIVAVYLFGLTIPLIGPDEPRYAQVAREMFERGDWVTPTLGGYDWFEKPALLYWLQIASYNIFGVSEFAARFGSALFGLGTIASLWVLGRNVAADKIGNSADYFGNLLALISASSIGIIVFSRGASFDIILTFPITASLVSFYLFDRAETGSPGSVDSAHRSPRSFPTGSVALAGFYFFIGIAILAKGLVGIVFPFAIVTFYHLLSWKMPSRMLILSVFWGTLLSVLVASAWYLPMYLTNGWKFVDEFFIQHHFQRYTSNKYFHPQPFYFFLWVLPLMTIPWLPFLFAGLWTSVREVISRKEAKTQSADTEIRSLRLFAFAWLLVPLVFFSFSGSKLPGYILPALPPCLIIITIYVSKFAVRDGKRRSLIVGLSAATFAVIVGLLIFALPKFADDDSVKRLISEADARGFRNAEVLSQHAISHNAEFYAAGRLLRSPDGKQMRLYTPAEILDEIRRRGGETVLVLVPNEWAHQTLESPLLAAEFITKNGEHSIIAASEHQP